MDIKRLILQIKEFILAQDYDQEVKEKLAVLLDKVAEEPTADNLDALAVVLKLLSNGEKYLAALETFSADEKASIGDKICALKNLVDIANS